VQGAMESSNRRRGYMEKRRRVEGKVSKFFFSDPSNLGDEIHFKGVDL
jgi:hypothetical protein